MRRVLGILGVMVMASASRPALGCGAGYGDHVTIKPSQTIGVLYRGGQETYIFKPHFCGAATEFGLILPVPAALTQNPALTDEKLFDQLETIAAPTVETVEVCADSSFLPGGGSNKAVDTSYTQREDDGVDVVSSGTVGQFQWELLRADTTQSFTQWLDTNHFAYPTGAVSAFSHYVQSGWYFVAFRVATGSTAPAPGYRLCGDFGPIALSFQTSKATIPARIATANAPNDNFLWRVLAIADHEQMITGSGSGNPYSTLTYAGDLSTSDLKSAPGLASLASTGQWFTAFNVRFGEYYFKDDIVITDAGIDKPYREHQLIYKEVNCGVFGCSIDRYGRRIPRTLTTAMLASLALLVARRRHR